MAKVELSNEANTNIGKFEDLQTAINDLLDGDANSRSQLAGYVSSMEAKFGDVKTIEDGLIVQPGDSSLLAQRSAKQSEIVTIASQLQTLEQSMLVARVYAASQLLSTNAAVTTNSTHEANQKTANRILLETIANDQLELTEQQVTDLTPIANQCPYEGGEGVYAARALLGNEVAYDDFTACGMASGGGQLIKAPESSNPASISFSIYPNPSSGWAVLELKEKIGSDGKLVVTNMQGIQQQTEILL